MWSLLRRTFTNLSPNEELGGCCLCESMILFQRSQFSVYIPLNRFWASFVLNEQEVTFSSWDFIQFVKGSNKFSNSEFQKLTINWEGNGSQGRNPSTPPTNPKRHTL